MWVKGKEFNERRHARDIFLGTSRKSKCFSCSGNRVQFELCILRGIVLKLWMCKFIQASRLLPKRSRGTQRTAAPKINLQHLHMRHTFFEALVVHFLIRQGTFVQLINLAMIWSPVPSSIPTRWLLISSPGFYSPPVTPPPPCSLRAGVTTQRGRAQPWMTAGMNTVL